MTPESHTFLLSSTLPHIVPGEIYVIFIVTCVCECECVSFSCISLLYVFMCYCCCCCCCSSSFYMFLFLLFMLSLCVFFSLLLVLFSSIVFNCIALFNHRNSRVQRYWLDFLIFAFTFLTFRQLWSISLRTIISSANWYTSFVPPHFAINLVKQQKKRRATTKNDTKKVTTD